MDVKTRGGRVVPHRFAGIFSLVVVVDLEYAVDSSFRYTKKTKYVLV